MLDDKVGQYTIWMYEIISHYKNQNSLQTFVFYKQKKKKTLNK